jgi:hypothetical protein
MVVSHSIAKWLRDTVAWRRRGMDGSSGPRPIVIFPSPTEIVVFTSSG